MGVAFDDAKGSLFIDLEPEGWASRDASIACCWPRRRAAISAKWTESLTADSRDALEVPFEPCIVMQDYHEDNVVVKQVYDEWRVSGVFDLGGAYFGDGEADICRLLATYLGEEVSLAKEFLKEFLKASPPRPGFEKRFSTYMLLDRLIVWEFVQRTESRAAAQMGSLREWAERYTTALPGLIP